jgi:hypothetical protein
VTLLPIFADAGKAGREHLRYKRNTLGRVLLDAEKEYGKHNEAAARTDPEKSRSEPSDQANRDAVKQTIGVQLLISQRSGLARQLSGPCDKDVKRRGPSKFLLREFLLPTGINATSSESPPRRRFSPKKGRLKCRTITQASSTAGKP